MDDIVSNLVNFTKESILSMGLSDIVFGEVISLSPLEIRLDQKLSIFKEQVLLTRTVLDYDVEMSVNGGQINTYRIFNGLQLGDKIVLVKAHGNQMYLVIDKVVQ